MDIEEAKRRAQAGPIILIARRGVALLITFVSTVTVARLVSPRDYGLANMSTVVLAFAAIFRDFGLTNAVLRKGHISQEELSLIFWFNAATTLALSAAIALASPAIAVFYDEPIVTWVTLLSVVGFMLTGISLQHRAVINRELRFGTLAVIDVVGSLLGLLLTIILAYQELGVWAIVLGGTFQSAVTSLSYIVLCGWKPSRFQRHSELGSLLRFGGNSSVFSISVFISNNLAPILIGRFVGSSGLGQYNRAQSLVNLPIANVVQPIAQAVMPLLTHLRREPDQYRTAYLQLVQNLSTVLMPLSVCLAVAGPDLVELLIGSRWHEAGLLLSCLTPVLAVMGFSYGVADLFITQDRAGELRSLGLYEVAIRTASIGVGLLFGLVGAALGFALSTVFVATIRVFAAGRRGPVTARDQLRQLGPALPLCAGALVGSSLALFATPPLSAAIHAPLTLAAGGATALAVGMCFPPTRHALAELAAIFGMRKLVSSPLPRPTVKDQR